jgi:hypothetical protein
MEAELNSNAYKLQSLEMMERELAALRRNEAVLLVQVRDRTSENESLRRQLQEIQSGSSSSKAYQFQPHPNPPPPSFSVPPAAYPTTSSMLPPQGSTRSSRNFEYGPAPTLAAYDPGYQSMDTRMSSVPSSSSSGTPASSHGSGPKSLLSLVGNPSLNGSFESGNSGTGTHIGTPVQLQQNNITGSTRRQSLGHNASSVGFSPFATEQTSNDLTQSFDVLDRQLTDLMFEKTSLHEESERFVECCRTEMF